MRVPRVLRRIGPSVRPSAARSIARATAGWQRDEDDLAAFASHLRHAMAVFLTEIADAGTAGFEDPQPEQAEQRDQGEVVQVGRQPRRGDQRFELQMPQSEGWGLGRHRWSSDVVGGRVRQDLVDDSDL
jgi:hypothetical protein